MRSGFISKYFPSPQFLKPRHLGLSFSDRNIKAFWYDKYSPWSSLQGAILPLPVGAIVEGKVVNIDQVATALSSLKKDFDSPFVFFTIPDELVYVFSVAIPTVKSDLTEAVAFTIEENIPISVKDAVFDFVPTGVDQRGSGYKASVVVASCVKEEVEKFLKAVRQSGLTPVGCVHESQAIAKALIKMGSQDTSCIVHAREKRIGIYLVEGETVRFVTIRNIASGGYEKQFLDEYEKFLEFALKDNLGDQANIKNILVCGEFEYAKQIVETIARSKSLSKGVKLADVWNNIIDVETHAPNFNFEDSLNFAGPIGAALSEIT